MKELSAVLGQCPEEIRNQIWQRALRVPISVAMIQELKIVEEYPRALGLILELDMLLTVAEELGYLKPAQAMDLRGEVDLMGKHLNALVQRAQSEK
jgi:hypothetical protein